MAQNSVNITTEENIVTVVEPSSTSITIIQNTDKSQVSSTTEVANDTSITQDVSVLTLASTKLKVDGRGVGMIGSLYTSDNIIVSAYPKLFVSI